MNKKTVNKQAVGYIRVSTSAQVQNGASLDAQRAHIQEWAKGNGYQTVTIFDDPGISAKRADNRPGLQRALDMATQEKAPLIVHSLSRLARSTVDAINIADILNKAGADMVSLTENINTTGAMGNLIFQLFSMLAEFERRHMGERISFAMQHLITEGRRFGRVPFGYDPDPEDKNRLIKNPVEQKRIKYILKLKKAGDTFRTIADKMQAKGYETKSGGQWGPSTVRLIIKRANNEA